MSAEIVEDFSQWPEAAPKPPVRRSYFREVTWTWRDVLIGLAPLALARVLPSLVGSATLQPLVRRTWLAVGLLGWGWMFGYPLVVAQMRLGRRPGLPRLSSLAINALFALLCVPVLLFTMGLIVALIIMYFGRPMIPNSPFEPVFRSTDRFDPLAVMVLGVSVGPLAEEVFFRGMLYNALRQRLPVWIAAPLQAIVFGLAHPFNLANAAAVAFIGLGLALIYEWRKTLVAPFFMHAFQNSLGFAILSFTVANTPILGVLSEKHEGGCAIVEVLPGSGAEAAGLRAGDIITKISDRPVSDPEHLSAAIRNNRIGDQVSVEILRDGKPQRVDVTLQKTPSR